MFDLHMNLVMVLNIHGHSQRMSEAGMGGGLQKSGQTDSRPVNSPGTAGRLPVLTLFSRSPGLNVFSPGCLILKNFWNILQTQKFGKKLTV